MNCSSGSRNHVTKISKNEVKMKQNKNQMKQNKDKTKMKMEVKQTK